MTQPELDPKGLIAEAYRMDGLSPGDCRVIFLDWVLGLPEGQAEGAAINTMLARHGVGAEDHPMTQVLRAGLEKAATPRRRGGRAGRLGQGG